MKSDKQRKKQYETYKAWYKKVAEANFMKQRQLTQKEFEDTVEMYLSTAKLTLSFDKNDKMANRIIKNVSRTIAYDQKEVSDIQMQSIEKGLKSLKIKYKQRDIKRKGLASVQDLLGEDYSLADVFDIGSP